MAEATLSKGIRNPVPIPLSTAAFFARFSEQVTRRHGITPLQYLLLLHIKGYPGREWATVQELAERLQSQHHGVVAW